MVTPRLEAIRYSCMKIVNRIAHVRGTVAESDIVLEEVLRLLANEREWCKNICRKHGCSAIADEIDNQLSLTEKPAPPMPSEQPIPVYPIPEKEPSLHGDIGMLVARVRLAISDLALAEKLRKAFAGKLDYPDHGIVVVRVPVPMLKEASSVSVNLAVILKAEPDWDHAVQWGGAWTQHRQATFVMFVADASLPGSAFKALMQQRFDDQLKSMLELSPYPQPESRW